jgi:hypothetical protein
VEKTVDFKKANVAVITGVQVSKSDQHAFDFELSKCKTQDSCVRCGSLREPFMPSTSLSLIRPSLRSTTGPLSCPVFYLSCLTTPLASSLSITDPQLGH